jgi:hypothetical protein
MSEAPVLHERDLLVLAKMLGMLGTSNDAERSVVGAKVHAWVTQRGVIWADLLIPPEPPEVEVSVNVGGRPAAAPQRPTQPPPGAGNGSGPRPAQAPPGGSGGQSWGHTTFPGWKVLAEKMLKDHAPLLRGTKENQFLADQIARALQYGNGVRISDKQEAWLRDILGRASLTW